MPRVLTGYRIHLEPVYEELYRIGEPEELVEKRMTIELNRLIYTEEQAIEMVRAFFKEVQELKP